MTASVSAGKYETNAIFEAALLHSCLHALNVAQMINRKMENCFMNIEWLRSCVE